MPFKLVTYIGDTRVRADTYPTREKAEEDGERSLEIYADSYLIVEVDDHGRDVK